MPTGRRAEARILNDFQRDQLRRRALLAVRIAIFAGLLAVIAALSAYLTVRRSVSGRDVQVPNLSSLSVEEASAILKKDPPPGSSIKLDRKVKVVVSLGDKVSSIPELRGGAARKAQITLQQQGMKLGDQVYVYSRKVEENMVIAQDPLPEGAGLRDAKIALLVSRGTAPRIYVMPQVVGRGETEVLAFLQRAGLRVAPLKRDASRAAPPGTVVAQDPDYGYPVRTGDLVTLTVAGGGREGG